MSKKALFLVVLICVLCMISGCKKSQEGSDSPTSFTPVPTEGNLYSNVISITPTSTPVPTEIPEKIEDASNLLTFEIQPITAPENMKTPYFTKEEFPIMDGSTANIPLAEMVYSYLSGESLEAAKEDIVFYKTPQSYLRLIAGSADILLVYEPPQSILQRMKEKEVELEFKPLGTDALVFIANEANPVNSLTKKQLEDIYSGKITKWSEIGGTEQDIIPFQRPKSSGSQTLMEKLVLSDTLLMNGPSVARPGEMSDLIDSLAAYTNESNALGYSVYYYAQNMYTKPGLKFLAVDKVMPSTETIQNGEYPYLNYFYVVIRKDEPEGSKARTLYEWLTTEEAQKLVAQTGYVPVRKLTVTEPNSGSHGVYFDSPFNIKETDYIVIHENDSDGVVLGDYLLDRNLNTVVSFPGKHICIEKNLICSSEDLLILESSPLSFNREENEILYQKYELYSLKDMAYITTRLYDDIYKTPAGYYVCEGYFNDDGKNILAIYNNKGQLIFEKRNSENNFSSNYAVVKDHILFVENNILSVIGNDGSILSSRAFPYSGMFENLFYTEDWADTRIVPGYFIYRTDQYFILLDSNGTELSSERFYKNVPDIKNPPKLWIDSIELGYDGSLYASGYIDGHYIVAKEDGTLLFDKKCTKEDYHALLLPGLFQIIDKTKPVDYFVSDYYTLRGEYLGTDISAGEDETSLPDKKSKIRANIGCIFVSSEGGFNVINKYTGEQYFVKSDVFPDEFPMTEVSTIPEIFNYRIEDTFYSKYKNIRSFTDWTFGQYYGDRYYIITNHSKQSIMDKQGNILYAGKNEEYIHNVLLGNELYIFVEEGNYTGIKKIDGTYIYRKLAPDND